MQKRKSVKETGPVWGDDLHPSPTQGWARCEPCLAVALRTPPPPLSAFVSTLTSVPAQVLGRTCQLVAGPGPRLTHSSPSWVRGGNPKRLGWDTKEGMLAF